MAYGESMEVDFAIIKLPVGRFVARFFVLEEVIRWHLRNGNKCDVTAFSPGLPAYRGKLCKFVYNSTIKLKPLAKPKAPLF